MSRNMWIIVLVAGGVAVAVAIGLLGTGAASPRRTRSRASARALTALEGSINSLTGLSPTSASKSDYQSAVDEIQSDWDAVKTDASDLGNITMSQLDSAWDSFESAVQGVPDDASVSDALNDVKSSAQSLGSTVSSTLTGPDCS